MGQENVSSKAKREFSSKDMAVVKKADEEQKQLHDFISNHSHFSEEEKCVLKVESVSAFEEQWNLTVDSRDKFEASHDHGAGLATRRAQQFVESAYDVLQHVDPIVQLVKDFGAPYGGMAIGTISFLFTIIKNKAKLEASIFDTLIQIKDRTAGLEVYRHIYADNHKLDQQLQSKIVQAYESFMNFCIAATRYYSSGRMRRWLKFTWRFPKSLEDRASEVQKSIVDVRYTSEELLSKSIDRIKQLNLNQMEEIKGLQGQLEKLQMGRDSDRLLAIQKLLPNLEIYSQESEWELVQKYHHDTDAHLDQQFSSLEVMKGPRLEIFKNDPKVCQWKNSKTSCILVLAGYNNDYLSGKCWLSPYALDTITNMRESQEDKLYAFYVLGHRSNDSFPQVIWCVLFQLLKQANKALQDDTQYKELYTEIEDYQRATETDGSKYNVHGVSRTTDTLLRKAALRILRMIDQNKTVWIILDRVDQCRSGTSKHQKMLIKALVYLLENAAVQIRILAIVNGYDWKVEEQRDEFGARNQSSVVVHTYEQRVIG
ncbi:hypothetical protein HDV63DRAFT_360870 [Trichoderma sp. SZMC 28014]